MRSINPDTTSLKDFNLTLDVILNGEKAEFEPEKKVMPRKVDYVQCDFATKVVDAYANDLLEAYRAIEALEAENDRLREESAESAKAAEASTAQVRKILQGDQKFADAEKLLAKFEQQLETLAKDKQADKSTIEALRSQVVELNELKHTVPKLQEDVNHVLDNLRGYFEAEGLEMPGDDYDDDYDESAY